MTRLPATASSTKSPPLITNSTNRSENGLIAVNMSDVGFLRSHRMPVMYAIKKACLTGSIELVLVSAILLIISNSIANKVDKHIVKRYRRNREWEIPAHRNLVQLKLAQHLLSLFSGSLLAFALYLQPVVHMVPRRERPERPALLWNYRDKIAHLPRLPDSIVPKDADAAGGRRKLRGAHAHKGSLACPVSTQKCKDPA